MGEELVNTDQYVVVVSSTNPMRTKNNMTSYFLPSKVTSIVVSLIILNFDDGMIHSKVN